LDSLARAGDPVERTLPGLAQALFAAASDALLLVDPPTEQVLDANPLAQALSGRPRDQLVGRSVRELIHHDSLDNALCQSLHEATGFQDHDGYALDSAGHVLRIPLRVSLVHVEVPGATPLALLTIRDRRRQAAADRRLVMTEAQRLDSLGVLAGGIAHDFNNLLTGILGNAGLARLSCAEDSPLLAPLEQIEHIAVRAADLCKQMLAFAGKAPRTIELIDVNSALHETAELMRVRLSPQAELQFDLAEALPRVHADETQLRQIVINLLLNASEALNEQAGVIRLTTGLRSLQPPATSYWFPARQAAEGDYVMLEVRDTGVGIPADMQTRIFEPFFTTKFTGRGLGLAAVLGIVRGHRGAIQVDSVLGKGTTMRVFLRRT
jgi:signal transduction histidine kinase